MNATREVPNPKLAARSGKTVNRIVDSAARLFGREGYRGASMQEVAREAGVSKSLLHYHFRSKEHLLIEAQRATFRQVHAHFQQRFQQGERGLQPALDGLDALWGSVVEMRAWTPFMVQTMSLAAQDSPLRAHADAFYEESMGLLEEGIETVFSAQMPQLMLPPTRLARLVRVTLHGLVVELAFARNAEQLDVLNQTYRDFRDAFAQLALGGPLTA